MKQMKQMKQMQQESRCTLAGLSDDEALQMMQQMQMMQPCTLQRASKGFKGCKMIRCTLEERKALEGLEKGLKDDAALKPCKHLEADARAFLQDDAPLKHLEADAPLQGLKPLQMMMHPCSPYIYIICML
jgi:hypothetical protein